MTVFDKPDLREDYMVKQWCEEYFTIYFISLEINKLCCDQNLLTVEIFEVKVPNSFHHFTAGCDNQILCNFYKIMKTKRTIFVFILCFQIEFLTKNSIISKFVSYLTSKIPFAYLYINSGDLYVIVGCHSVILLSFSQMFLFFLKMTFCSS